MKKKLLSIGLSLAVLGGSAVTAMPANAATSTSKTTNTVTKQKAQKEITQLQTANKKLEEQLKFLELNRADTRSNISNKNDKIAVDTYFKYRSEKRTADYEKCKVDAIKQITKKVNAQVSKGKISKSYANGIAENYKSELSRAQKNADKATAQYKSDLVISKHFEALGKTWKIERPVHEKFDERKISDKKNCLNNESNTYRRLTSTNLKGSAKDKSAVKAIADDYKKNQYRTTQYNIQKESYDLHYAMRSHNFIINNQENTVKAKISANKKKIAQLQSVK